MTHTHTHTYSQCDKSCIKFAQVFRCVYIFSATVFALLFYPIPNDEMYPKHTDMKYIFVVICCCCFLKCQILLYKKKLCVNPILNSIKIQASTVYFLDIFHAHKEVQKSK